MEQNNIQTDPKKKEISILDLISTAKKYWSYLLTKWFIIIVFGIIGGALGLAASILTKPTYTAHLSFSLVEKSANGGLADLASNFGFGGGVNNGTFSGDNLLEIIRSRYAIEKTLLTPVNCAGQRMNLIEVYIDFKELRTGWSKSESLKKLAYPVGQNRESFTRVQDSVLNALSNSIVTPKTLSIARKDKKISIVNVDFTSTDELFSKLFVETLMQQTYLFYKDTKTSQSRANINTMQHTADSIKNLYDNALYKNAGISQININPALQFAAIPKIKQENNIQLYGAVYTEVLKNLETLKLDMARETPIVQIIDSPRLPLLKERLGKAKGLILGGFIGGFLIIFSLIGFLYLKTVFLTKLPD